MNRLRRLVLALASLSLVAPMLFVIGPTPVMADSEPVRADAYNFDTQSRTFNFAFNAGNLTKTPRYEWSKAFGKDPSIVFSTASNSGDVTFTCSDIARGLILSLRVRNASGKQVYTWAYPVEKCPIETLKAHPIVEYNADDGSQIVTFLNGKNTNVSGTLKEWFIGTDRWMGPPDNQEGFATFTATYRGDEIGPVTFDITNGITHDLYYSIYGDAALCALFDKHIVASFVVRAVDGSVIVQDDEAIPPCPAGYFTPEPTVTPSPSPAGVSPSPTPDVTATPSASVTPTASPDPISPARHAEATRLRIIGTIAFVLAWLIAFFGLYLPRRRRRKQG